MQKFNDLQIEIISILLDDEGHALWELASRLDKEASNLIGTPGKKGPLARLEEEVFEKKTWDWLSFSFHDMKNLPSLVAKLREPDEPLSKFLYDQFSSETKRLLDGHIDHETMFDLEFLQKEALTAEFDRLLSGPSIFDEELFAHVELSDETISLIDQNPEFMDLVRLNRFLLEESYPNEIVRSQKGIICKDNPRKTTRRESKRPNQPEFPYYINKDWRVFNLIPDYFADKIEALEKNIYHLDELYEEMLYDLAWKQGYSDKDIARLKPELKSSIQYEGQNKFFYEQELKQNLENIVDFSCSQYASNMIEIFGDGILICDTIDIDGLTDAKIKLLNGDIDGDEYDRCLKMKIDRDFFNSEVRRMLEEKENDHDQSIE